MTSKCNNINAGFDLNHYKGKKALERGLGTSNINTLDGVLKHMRKDAFNYKHGGRKGVKKMAVLIIDEDLKNPRRALQEAKRARLRGVEIYVIQIARQKPPKAVMMMSDDPRDDHFFSIPSFDDLPVLKDRFLTSLCDGKYSLKIRRYYLYSIS